MSSSDILVPSINFAMLCPGIYRSGYPTKKNFSFLKALKLRSVCYLCPEEYASTNQKFCEENGIQVLRFQMEGNKEPFIDIPESTIHLALSALLDVRNQPILIHCNKGKHRTGTLCGCVRRTQGWCLSSIFAEYMRFAGDKARPGDQQCIELYRPVVLLTRGCVPRWFVRTPDITVLTSMEELRQVVSATHPTLPNLGEGLRESVTAANKKPLAASGGGGGGVGGSAAPSASAAPPAVVADGQAQAAAGAAAPLRVVSPRAAGQLEEASRASQQTDRK